MGCNYAKAHWRPLIISILSIMTIGFMAFSVGTAIHDLIRPVYGLERIDGQDKIDDLNHVEWDTACVHALDVTLTQKQVKKFIRNGTLSEQITSRCHAEIRYPPKYRLTEVKLTADVSNIKAQVTSEGYPVRIILSSGEYIEITLFVKKDVGKAIVKNKHKKEIKKQSKSTSAKVIDEKKPLIVSGGPTTTGKLVAAGVSVILAALIILMMLPELMIVKWHKLKKREILERQRRRR